MKALSIRQPWLYAILHLGKRVENREWAGCAYRGPVLLHASKTLVLHEFDADVERILDAAWHGKQPQEHFLAACAQLGDYRGDPIWRPVPTLPLGGIVGRARIVGCIDGQGGRSWSLTAPVAHESFASPWYAGDFALVLSDVEPLPFIPWKGSLGFFDVPDDVVTKAVARRADFGVTP